MNGYSKVPRQKGYKAHEEKQFHQGYMKIKGNSEN
jgi:hypothetical protein